MRRFSLQCAQRLLFIGPIAVLLLISVTPARRKPTIMNSTIPIST
ncbi:MAG TPA: hypothetical protein VF394_12180 [Candidatus Acidoferrum sp.]